MNSVLQSPEPRRFWIPLAVFLALCFAVAALGGAATATSVGTWYQALEKPSFNPPDWIFGPVWTTLYAMMALAAALAWRDSHGPVRRTALGWFLAQLALNLAWSCIFFGLQLVGMAFVCLTLLWIAVFGTLVHFWAIRLWAGLLLLPYLVWISFAGLLNFLIWRLN